MKKPIRILGIESSCDETGVAIYDSEEGIIAEELFSQVALHAQHGGVVPELASRDHVLKLLPLIASVLEKSQLLHQDLSAIAYTKGPGLAGALLVGAATAKALAFAWKLPAIGIHHLEGHLLAPLLEKNPPSVPLIALLVSGGHTLLARVAAIGQYEIVGESLDDAAGEAFDKTAKLLGLGYPGGPALALCAQDANEDTMKFPRPLIDRPTLEFSFSGLKTSVAQAVARANAKGEPLNRAQVAYGFQESVVDVLVSKCIRALKQTGYKQLLVVGGVGANTRLRERLQQDMNKEGFKVAFPRLSYCTDNGAMIAFAGYYRFLWDKQDLDWTIGVNPRWPLEDISV